MATMTKLETKTVLLVVVATAFLLQSVPAAATDPRVESLVKMLDENPNYRVRVQAARSLGRLRSPEAVQALVKALEDSDPLVVVSAASALGCIGSAEALAPLQKLALSKDPAVKSQAQAAIRQIEAILKMSGKSEEGKDIASIERMEGLKAMLTVGKMGDASGLDKAVLKEVLRNAIQDEASRTIGYVLLPEGTNAAELERLVKGKGVLAYLIQGSLVKIENKDGNIEADVSLILLSNPGNEIRAMITGKAKIEVPPGTTDAAALAEIEKEAVATAGRGGFHGLAQHMESKAPK